MIFAFPVTIGFPNISSLLETFNVVARNKCEMHIVLKRAIYNSSNISNNYKRFKMNFLKLSTSHEAGNQSAVHKY
jgi:hypothetical protein